MKKLEAVVRVERLRVVQEQLKKLKIGGIMLHAAGWSKIRKLHARYRGLPVSYDLIPVVKVEVIVEDDMLNLAVDTSRKMLELERSEMVLYLYRIWRLS